jgi:hypothetical protein
MGTVPLLQLLLPQSGLLPGIPPYVWRLRGMFERRLLNCMGLFGDFALLSRCLTWTEGKLPPPILGPRADVIGVIATHGRLECILRYVFA